MNDVCNKCNNVILQMNILFNCSWHEVEGVLEEQRLWKPLNLYTLTSSVKIKFMF